MQSARHATLLREHVFGNSACCGCDACTIGAAAVSLAMKPVGKPDAGNRHVRFDERGGETGRLPMAQATAPFLDSTEHLVLAGGVIWDVGAPGRDRVGWCRRGELRLCFSGLEVATKG